jgi:hypothetical protein
VAAEWARGLPGVLAQHDLTEIGAEGDVLLFQGASPMAEFWSLTWTQLRGQILASGVIEDQLDRAFGLLNDPKQWFVGPTLVAAWGRHPAG